MIKDFILTKFPSFSSMSTEDQEGFLSSFIGSEENYEEFRTFIGKRVFCRDDFEDWEHHNFIEFFTHPKYPEFDLYCTQFLGQGKDKFFLSERKFSEYKTLYENDLACFNTQSEYVPHLIDYHPYPFEEMYGMIKNLDGKDVAISGHLSSFQRVFTNLMFEFCSRHSNSLTGPSWLQEKDLHAFQSIAHRNVRDSVMYQIISSGNQKICDYMENNGFIFIDKFTESFYRTNMPTWNIYISSINDVKRIKIDNFMGGIKDRLVDSIPDEFILFFRDTIYKCIIDIIGAFKHFSSESELNQIGTLSKIRDFKPIKIFFHANAISDLKNILEFGDRVTDTSSSIKNNEEVSSIYKASTLYNTHLFGSIYLPVENEIDAFVIKLSSSLLDFDTNLKDSVSERKSNF